MTGNPSELYTDPQHFFLRSGENQDTYSWEMEDPILVTMNTSDTTERLVSRKLQAQKGYALSSRSQHFALDSPKINQNEKNHVLKKDGNLIHNVIRQQGMQIKERTETKLQEGSSQLERIQSRVNLHVARYNWTTKKDPKN